MEPPVLYTCRNIFWIMALYSWQLFKVLPVSTKRSSDRSTLVLLYTFAVIPRLAPSNVQADAVDGIITRRRSSIHCNRLRF